MLQVWDTMLARYPNVRIVWAHMGLSKELKRLHPIVHRHIMTKLFDRSATKST
jgi:predicted TIM-barrel fold metal-dependent hydrolase